MAGLTPMMFGISLDFGNGGYTVDSPTALWWKQLATAVVFGLGIATVLTLVFTPSLLALRIWFWSIMGWVARALARMGADKMSRSAQDWALNRQARRVQNPTIFWDEDPRLAEPASMHDDAATPATQPNPPLRAAE